jgi:hypothetical protein
LVRAIHANSMIDRLNPALSLGCSLLLPLRPLFLGRRLIKTLIRQPTKDLASSTQFSNLIETHLGENDPPFVAPRPPLQPSYEFVASVLQ